MPVKRTFDDDERRTIESLLGHRFAAPSLLEQAFTHASFANQPSRAERSEAPEDASIEGYDRLEFLGDAVLGLILAEHAYRGAPDASSGVLTSRRARLARRAAVASAASRLDLGRFVRMSEGEARQGGTHRRRLLADVFEAVVGAIYLDAGLEAVRRFVIADLISSTVLGEDRENDDPKSLLQERLQGEGRAAPRYRTVEVSGSPHSPTFLVEVEVEGEAAGRGTGRSRREAEQEAARKALKLCSRG